MRAAGAADEDIAKALGVPIEAVGRLVQIGEQKLQALIHGRQRRTRAVVSDNG
jgi:DNA-directed RNA polymerase specialized sigma24 family protein